MGILSITFREGSPTGRAIILHCPIYTGTEAKPDTVSVRSGAVLIRDYGEIITYDTTFICTRSETVTKMLGQGFNYLIDLSETLSGNPYRLYWGENYIELYRNADYSFNVIYHDVLNSDSFELLPGSNALNDAAFSFPAVIPLSITDWMTVGWRLWDWTIAGEPNSYFEAYDNTSGEKYVKLKKFYEAIPRNDPYMPGGMSGPGGPGDGTFDFTSTDIPIPGLPTIGAMNTGFLTLYKPADSDLRGLASYMWSGAFDIDNFRKIVANPMDAILGLHIIPTSDGHPYSSSATLRVGNISTGLSMPQCTEQYYELDCGTVTISPKWGAYLDYSPYSKLSLYLPYVGIVPISPDDCMGGSIRVVYHVDILSGSCCVYVYCVSNKGADGHTLYVYTGACACDCPVTEGQYTNAVLGILGIAGGVAGAISAGALGNAAGISGGLESAANAAISMAKPDIGRSGNFGGSAGLMGIQYPFLILTVPKMCTPGDQDMYRGYPSFVTKQLSDVEGYCQVEITHLEGLSATAEEVDELRAILESGVIL